MEPEIILARKERGGRSWAEITLNRPAKGNALTLPLLESLNAALGSVESDRTLRALVIRGSGRFFCTGGDIGEWGGLSAEAMANSWILRGIEVLQRLAALPQPVIAVMHGTALGGGLELALAADVRIAVRSARLGMPEVTLGMISGWGGVRKLAETIGAARARQMLLTGSPIDAQQALEWGLVNAVAEDLPGLEIELDALLDSFLANAPLALQATKEILAGLHLDLRQQHAAAAGRMIATEDCQEGVRAFREKRRPVFRGY